MENNNMNKKIELIATIFTIVVIVCILYLTYKFWYIVIPLFVLIMIYKLLKNSFFIGTAFDNGHGYW